MKRHEGSERQENRSPTLANKGLNYSHALFHSNIIATISTIKQDEGMLPPTAGSMSNFLPLPPPFSRQPQRSKRKPPKRIVHSWSDEELNLLSYYRRNHRWTYSQIRKAYFPSLSISAVKKAHQRLPTEDRVRRASAAAALIATSRNTVGVSRNTPETQPTRSSVGRGPSHSHRPVPRPTPQSESNVETLTSSTPSSENQDRTITSNGINRYNFRPNRPTVFRVKKPRYLVDHLRFPHFFKSYKTHLKPHAGPDENYAPPSHSPTPDPSDRSPTVISSQLSEVSSLELFGLEARSPSPTEHSPILISSQSSDVLSSEPVSPTECLPSP